MGLRRPVRGREHDSIALKASGGLRILVAWSADLHQVLFDTDAHRRHVERLANALRHEPRSPGCSNWLRYGVQPRNPKPGLVPGRCRGKAHRRETLGFGGRRVLVSRRWSGKTLADHRADRIAWVREQLEALGHTDSGSGTGPAGGPGPGADPARTVCTLLRPGDPAAPRREHLLLQAVAQRRAWRAQLDAARGPTSGNPPGGSGGVTASCAA